MRFLFTTLQHIESDFYGRVGSQLVRLGHDVTHVTFSRRAAANLRRRGFRSYCLPDVMASLGGGPTVRRETARIERLYDMPSLRDVYRTDPPCEGKSEDWCIERTLRHFLALERVFDDLEPEVVVPEVGSETMRTAAHLIGLERGIPVLFLLYTIFPEPLRLSRDTLQGPLVPPEEVRPLGGRERAEVEAFIARFTRQASPIRAYLAPRLAPSKLRELARHAVVRTVYERDNDYLRPAYFVTNYLRKKLRSGLAKRLYEPLDPSRPFVYFPLHVANDYKIRRLVPHCVHQDAIVEQLAEALPQGHDLVVKEHPMSIGRNRVRMLRRLASIPNVRLVDPYASTHELIRAARAVTVISSTVGLEALLYGKPVLTLGRPFYAGFGVTLDVDSFREIRAKVPALLDFRPDHERILSFLHAGMRRCRPGKPVLVDASDENALELAASLDAEARLLAQRESTPPPEAARSATQALSARRRSGLSAPSRR